MVAAPFYILTTSVGAIWFLLILTNACYFLFLKLYASYWVWGGISWFLFAFSYWLLMLSMFSCACCLCIFFGEMSIETYWPFLNWVICFFIFELQVFFIYSGHWIFIRYMSCKSFPICVLSFHFYVMPIDAQRFLIFMKYNLSFSSVACAFGVISKNALPNSRSWRFTPLLLKVL